LRFPSIHAGQKEDMRDGRHGGIAKAKAACVYKGLNRRGQGAGVEEIAMALKIGRASVYRVLNTA
jgi:hypothetical protein